MLLWINIEVTDLSILTAFNFIFKFKIDLYKNANIANFVYYGKTRLRLCVSLQ